MEPGVSSSNQMNVMQQLEVEQLSQTDTFDKIKGGIKVNDYLRWNSILDDEEVKTSIGFGKHMRKHFHCDSCNAAFIFNASEMEEHTRSCGKLV